jgi:hypothetical protein
VPLGRIYQGVFPDENDTEAERLARTDLEKLMELISISRILKSYFRSRDLIRSSDKIKFKLHWTLFGHGDKVLGRSYMTELPMFEVKSCTPTPYARGSSCVRCSAFAWYGAQFSIYLYNFYIKEYVGEKPINRFRHISYGVPSRRTRRRRPHPAAQ